MWQWLWKQLWLREEELLQAAKDQTAEAAHAKVPPAKAAHAKAELRQQEPLRFFMRNRLRANLCCSSCLR